MIDTITLYDTWTRMSVDSLAGELAIYEGTERGEALRQWMAERETSDDVA